MRRILPFLAFVVFDSARKDLIFRPLTTPRPPVSTLPCGLAVASERNDEDKTIAKLIFTIPYNDVYYNTNVTAGRRQTYNFGLDLTQMEIWVMNENFYSCDQVFSYYQVEFGP